MRNLDSRHPYFYEFHAMGAPLLFGLIIITFGFYMIPWIYTKNKEFEQIDPHSPNPNRGAVLLLLLPFAWGYLLFIIRRLIWEHPIMDAINVVGWIFIIFLLLKYIWDFCQSFGRITDTNGTVWFVTFIVPFLAIPAMQAELNSHFQRIQMRRKYHQLYK